MLKNIKYILWLLLLIPTICYAYSDYIYASGENIGIKINTSNVLVIGFYEINGISPANEAGLRVGDKIVSVNDQEINSIRSLEQIISNNRDSSIKIGYIRNSKVSYTNIDLIDNNI